MGHVVVLHGPNLNLLGRREPAIYGSITLEELNNSLHELANELGHTLEAHQSNHEGELVDLIQGCQADAVILNAAAYTHTSVAIRDAVSARNEIVFIEVHLTNPKARESFRRQNLLEDVVHGRIEGFGSLSYVLALRAASALIAQRGNLNV